MEYVALKYTRIGGQDFKVGEAIPGDLVDPVAAETLKKAHVIVVKESEAAEPEKILVPLDEINLILHAEEGDLELNLTKESLQSIVDVLTSNVKEAAEIIGTITVPDALILIDATDPRKSIQQAAKDRALALIPPEEAGEQ